MGTCSRRNLFPGVTGAAVLLAVACAAVDCGNVRASDRNVPPGEAPGAPSGAASPSDEAMLGRLRALRAAAVAEIQQLSRESPARGSDAADGHNQPSASTPAGLDKNQGAQDQGAQEHGAKERGRQENQPENQPSPAGENGQTARKLSLLRAMDTVYFHHASLLEQKDRLEAEVKSTGKEQTHLEEFGLEEPRPYSFLLFEAVQDRLADEAVRAAAIKADAKAAKQSLDAAHRELDRAEAQRQAAAASGASVETLAAPERLQTATPQALAMALARAKLSMAETDADVQKARLEACQARQKLLEKKIELLKSDVKFSAQDRDAELERLTALETDLDSQRALAETRFHELESDDQDAAGGPSRAMEHEHDESDVWRAAREIYNARLLLLDQRREQIGTMRRLWKHRYEFAEGDVSAQSAKQWLTETDEFLDQLADWSKSWDHRFSLLNQAAAPGATPAGGQAARSDKWSGYREASFHQLRAAYDAAHREVARAERSLGRFHNDLKAVVAKSAKRRGLVGAVEGAWEWEVLHDDKESITFGKLVVLLFFVLAGLALASVASRVVGWHVLRRLGWHHGKTAAIKSILFYTLFLFFGVVAFRAMHIPVGAFAFLGGAAAIAIGFGSQDIMNNFMSGIILLTEQPIRVGDVILLKDIEGQVTQIGLRCTRLLTEANHEIIVPNSALLADSVTNMTLTDQFVRHMITIDIDRNRPVAASKLRMLQLAFSHPSVIKSPQPIVLLTEVDCYALRFQVHFWLEHRSLLRCSQVRSEIMEMITAEFPCLDGESIPAAAGPAVDRAALSNGAAPEERNGATPKIHVPSAQVDPALARSIRQMSRAVLKKELKQLR